MSAGWIDPSATRAAVCVVADDDEAVRRAAVLADRLGLPLCPGSDASWELLLAVSAERVELRFPQGRRWRPLWVDFVGGPLGYRARVGRPGLLHRAVGLRGGLLRAVDATGGLARDAFLLALHGCQVLAVERSGILVALVEDGLARARGEPALRERLAGRLTVVQADARELLAKSPAEDRPDVVYLDPMYAPRGQSALVRREMRILRQLVGDDPDAGELFEIACSVARRHVVVKRMHDAPPLAPGPTRTYVGRTTRYDVYTTRAATAG